MAITRSQASLSVWPMSIHQLSIGQIKSHSHTQCQWKEVSSPHCKSTWHKEKLTPIPLKFFPKIEGEEILQNSFYFDTKTRQRHWKKLQTSIFEECWCKNPQKNTSKQKQQHIKQIICHDQMECIPGMQGWLNNRKWINEICHINRIKGEKRIMLIDAEKHLTKINTICDKALNTQKILKTQQKSKTKKQLLELIN